MTDEDTPEPTMTISGVNHNEIICPFSSGKWKRFGDALVFFVLFIAPILFLIAIITTKLL